MAGKGKSSCPMSGCPKGKMPMAPMAKKSPKASNKY